MPMTLYSPSLTSKPRKAVKALYSRPSECGKRISRSSERRPVAAPKVAVAHSPTPSTVRIAASSKGEHRRRWRRASRWCSLNRIFRAAMPSRLRMCSSPRACRAARWSWRRRNLPRPRDRLQRGGQDALELHERLLVEDDVVESCAVIPACSRQNWMASLGKAGVVLLAREALLLRRGDQLPSSTKAAAASW